MPDTRVYALNRLTAAAGVEVSAFDYHSARLGLEDLSEEGTPLFPFVTRSTPRTPGRRGGSRSGPAETAVLIAIAFRLITCGIAPAVAFEAGKKFLLLGEFVHPAYFGDAPEGSTDLRREPGCLLSEKHGATWLVAVPAESSEGDPAAEDFYFVGERAMPSIPPFVKEGYPVIAINLSDLCADIAGRLGEDPATFCQPSGGR